MYQFLQFVNSFFQFFTKISKKMAYNEAMMKRDAEYGTRATLGCPVVWQERLLVGAKPGQLDRPRHKGKPWRILSWTRQTCPFY
jgi:hypothetical protein